MKSSSRVALWLTSILCLAAPRALAGPAPLPACTGERVAVLPLMPVATVPAVAKLEEERLRAELAKTKDLCVVPRSETIEKLGSASPISCDDANCRQRLADQVDAAWVLWGTVYGFGAKTTVSAMIWDRTGERVSRRSYEPGPEVQVTAGLLAGARALPASGVPAQAAVRGRVVPLALGGTGLVALAAGTAFGVASLESARQLSTGTTGCPGLGGDYLVCLDEHERNGRNQARAANILFGAAALFGIGAGVSWIVSWP